MDEIRMICRIFLPILRVGWMFLYAWSTLNAPVHLQSQKKRPKARGLARHGAPPGWLEMSDPAGVILYGMDGPYGLTFLVALTGAAQLRADETCSCLLYSK
jgi:hypothetical protein